MPGRTVGMDALRRLVQLGSTTRFRGGELTAYAERFMVDETRRGVMAMSFVSLMLLSATSLLYTYLGFATYYAYTNVLLAALSLHIILSSRVVRDIKVLHLLGMTLLTINGVAFVLLAHRGGSIGPLLFGSVILLFMVVPMVPWGLKEAAAVVALIYVVFTGSTWGRAAAFDGATLVTLQFVMLGSSLVTLTLVGRSARLRRDDIQARFDLEGAHQRVELLSFQDALTGLWNRRYLQERYPELLAAARDADQALWFVLCDLNEFKAINDTLGHDVGDKVLKWFAGAFKTQVGERGIAVRIGGDEFVLVFSYHSPHELLNRCLESVQALAQQDHLTRGAEIGLSAGVLALPADTPVPLETAYRQVDEHLYAAKRRESLETQRLRIVSPGRGGEGREVGRWIPAH